MNMQRALPVGGTSRRSAASPSRLVAAVVLACAAALVFPTAAEAQQTVWSATLTPRTINSFAVGCLIAVANCSDPNNLSDDDFVYDGTTYEIRQFDYDGNRLNFTVVPAFAAATDDLVLVVGDRSLRLDAANQSVATLRWWLTTGLNWTVGADVSVSLIVPSAPVAPLALSAPTVSTGDDSLKVSWDAPPSTGRSPVRSYDLRYREGTSGAWIPGPQNVTGTSATISGLRAGTTYQVQVRANHDEGPGPWSPSWTGQTEGDPPTAPDAPRNLRAVSGDGAVTLSWDAPISDGGAAITDYEYQIDGVGEWISIGSTKRTHTISGLTNGTVYVFRVRAVNRIGAGQSRRVRATAGAVLNFAHFANGDRHHLRSGVRESVPPADPARALLLRSGGRSH